MKAATRTDDRADAVAPDLDEAPQQRRNQGSDSLVHQEGRPQGARASRSSASARNRRLRSPSVGRRLKGLMARPLSSCSGRSGSTGTRTSCRRKLQSPRAGWRASAARCDSRNTRRTRLRTGEDGRSFLGTAIMSRGALPAGSERASNARWADELRRERAPAVAAAGVTNQASDAQALAALGAARGDHGATATGLHADQETVRALATDHGGLIGAFHGVRTGKRKARHYSKRAGDCQCFRARNRSRPRSRRQNDPVDKVELSR
jgi:hypothetical protein